VRNLFVKESLVPARQWFTLEVIAKGPQVIVMVDGKETKKLVDNTPFLKGRFVLTGTNQQSLIEYRKIEIKDLTDVKAPKDETNRKIVNRNSDKVIGVLGASTKDGTPVVQWQFVDVLKSNQ